MGTIIEHFWKIQTKLDKRTTEYKDVSEHLKFIFGEIIMLYTMKHLPQDIVDELYEYTKSEYHNEKILPRLEELKNA